MNPEFVFYHIPKCGGTSLRDFLYKILKVKYSNEEIYYPRTTRDDRPVYGNMNMSTQHELDRVSNYFDNGMDHFKAILCHIKYDTDYLSFKSNKDVIDFLVMRDPIDRIISHYNFFDTRLFDSRPIHELSVDQIRLYCESRGNVMFTYLRGQTDTGYIGSIDDARRNIDNIKYKTTLESMKDRIGNIAKGIMKDLEINTRIPTLQWLQKGNVEVSRYQEVYDTVQEICNNFADVRLYDHLKQTL